MLEQLYVNHVAHDFGSAEPRAFAEEQVKT